MEQNNQIPQTQGTYPQAVPAAAPQQTAPQAIPRKSPSFIDKGMILPLIVIIILIIAAIIGYTLWNRSNTATEEQILTQEDLQQSSQQATEQSDTDICRSKALQTDKDECFFSLARQHISIEYCNMIGAPSGDISVDACYQYIAVKNANNGICQSMAAFDGENSYNSCMFNVAKSANNPIICALVSAETGKYTKSECIKQFNMTEESYKKKYGM